MRVELEHVGKRFGPVVALRDVTVTLPAGARAALIGPNGAGKSTLTRIVMGMLDCAGTVRVDGRSPFDQRAHVAQHLAYVPQTAPQLGCTVGELVRTVARLRGLDAARVRDVGAEFGLDIDGLRRRSLRGLSGGMRQKLLLAMALATDASLLILDEPTASLDVASRRRFFALVGELPAAPSILLCSHRLEEIRHLVDRVLVLEDGAVAYDGEADDYLRRSEPGVVEVRPASERAGRWLDARGFSRSASGWWSRETRNGQRVALVEEIVKALGGDLADLVVRDPERLPDAGRERS